MKCNTRSLTQMMANRMATRNKTHILTRSRASRARGEREEQGEGFLRRGELTNDDKIEAVRYLEKKCRISFNQAFGPEHFQWVVAKNGILLERDYDPSKRSYYLFGGRITITLTTYFNEQSTEEQRKIVIDTESGIGWLFGEETYNKTEIWLHSGTMLRIIHPSSSLRLIERNCLMTLRQKQFAVSKLKLFSPIENLSKLHVPFFNAVKFSKGDAIYLIGDQSKDLFIIIEGVVAFESQITPQEHTEHSPLLPRAPLKKTVPVLVITETVSKGSYFGEEEVINRTVRKQNAKCLSIQCLLLVVPQDRLEKLMTYPEFKRSLELSAVLKQQARNHQITTIQAVAHKREEPASLSPQNVQKFDQLKSVIYSQLSPSKDQRLFRSKYAKDRKKVVHNHSMSVPEGLPTPPRTSDFSMLNVNKAMYDKTLLRFRYSLKEIQKSAMGKQRAGGKKGRSLQDIWRTLKLQKSFNAEEEHIELADDGGLAYYWAHQRMMRQIRESKCLRPKSLNCSNKIKAEYIEYLQMVL